MIHNHANAVRRLTIFVLSETNGINARSHVSPCLRSLMKRDFMLRFVYLLLATVSIYGQQNDELSYESLDAVYRRYSAANQHDSAAAIAKQMADQSLLCLGDSSLRYAQAMRMVAAQYDMQRQIDSALYYYVRASIALMYQRRDKHPEFARVLSGIGGLLGDQADYRMSSFFLEQSVALMKASYGEGHPDVSLGLYNLAVLCFQMGDYERATDCLHQDLSSTTKRYGPRHIDCYRSVSVLAEVYLKLGMYDKAEEYCREGLDIIQSHFGDTHPMYGNSLGTLGVILMNAGDYRSSEQHLLESVRIAEGHLSKETGNEGLWELEYAYGLNNLATLYRMIGDEGRTLEMLEKSMSVVAGNVGEEHPDYAALMVNVAEVRSSMGSFHTADSMMQRAVGIIGNTLGERHPTYAAAVMNHGLIHFDNGQLHSADSLLSISAAITGTTLGETHPEYAIVLLNRSRCKERLGEVAEAKRMIVESMSVIGKDIGEDHPLYATLLHVYARLEIKSGQMDSACWYAAKTLKLKVRQVQREFTWLSMREKQAYWNQERLFYDDLVMLAAEEARTKAGESRSSSETAYNATLLSKAILLESSIQLDKAVGATADTLVRRHYAEMKRLRHVYSKLHSEGSAVAAELARYAAQADSLDRLLLATAGSYPEYVRSFSYTWRDVQRQLKPNEAAIEFARFNDAQRQRGQYIAMVVRPGYTSPRVVHLCPEQDIVEAVQYRDYEGLYDLIWRPVDTLLSGVRSVNYSPAGVLHNVAFAALGKENTDAEDVATYSNSMLVERYQLNQLTTTRSIADGSIADTKLIGKRIALFGGVDYGQASNLQSQDVAQVHVGDPPPILRSNQYDVGVPFLPGTEQEVAGVAQSLTSYGWDVSLVTGKQATEQQFVSHITRVRPDVIHVATHGFAFPNPVKKHQGANRQERLLTYQASDDPMVRAGLMFAGANLSWTGNAKRLVDQTGDDGIATASEVANLNLSKCSLVVLSACETGLGRIDASEGTFGLVRGFKMAGVRNAIVSLWAVSDHETQQLMTSFYGALAETGNIVDAFSSAQRHMRERHPRAVDVWAGFVLIR